MQLYLRTTLISFADVFIESCNRFLSWQKFHLSRMYRDFFVEAKYLFCRLRGKRSCSNEAFFANWARENWRKSEKSTRRALLLAW